MATIAWVVFLYSDGALCFVILQFGWNVSLLLIYNLLVVLALTAHLKTMLSDPGSVPQCARPLPASRDAGMPETICGRCDAYKPPRSHHCRICGRCIVRMDHHCPWMNNCIGARNQKHFILFLTYTWAQCVFILVLVVVRLSSCDASLYACFPGLVGRLTISIVTLSILALVFVSSMLYNQVYAILTGIGTIDRMKRRTRHIHHMPLELTDVFGDDPLYLWFFPINPTFHSEEAVLRYATLGNTWRLTSNDEEAADA